MNTYSMYWEGELSTLQLKKVQAKKEILFITLIAHTVCHYKKLKINKKI